MSYTYTLVVYRPNGVDTCRNCVMGTSNSDFEIEVFKDKNALAEWKAKHFFSRPRDREYCDPQYTLLLNGLREDDESWDQTDSEERYEERRECERLFEAARLRLEAEAAERKRLAQEEAARKATEAAILAARKKEEADRAQYQALKAKFG